MGQLDGTLRALHRERVIVGPQRCRAERNLSFGELR